jgi:hypothetical protein
MCGGGGGSDGSEEMLQYQKEQDQKREERARRGMAEVDAMFDGGFTRNGQRHRGFDDSFFDQRRQAYLDFANPQVDRQFGDAGDQLVFALSRAGTGQSSMAARRHADLRRDYDQERERVAMRAANEEGSARQAVSDERSRITSLVQSGARPDAVSAMLPSVAQALDIRPNYGPVGPLFQSATAGIGAYQQGQAFGNTANSVNARYQNSPF